MGGGVTYHMAVQGLIFVAHFQECWYHHTMNRQKHLNFPGKFPQFGVVGGNVLKDIQLRKKFVFLKENWYTDGTQNWYGE